jgi:hypothetical protein
MRTQIAGEVGPLVRGVLHRHLIGPRLEWKSLNPLHAEIDTPNLERNLEFACRLSEIYYRYGIGPGVGNPADR